MLIKQHERKPLVVVDETQDDRYAYVVLVAFLDEQNEPKLCMYGAGILHNRLLGCCVAVAYHIAKSGHPACTLNLIGPLEILTDGHGWLIIIRPVPMIWDCLLGGVKKCKFEKYQIRKKNVATNTEHTLRMVTPHVYIS
jgi:hypothetical protein